MKATTSTHPIVKWIFIALLILFIYELYKQIKTGIAAGTAGIAGAVANAGQAVLQDLGNVVAALSANPIGTVLALPALLIGFISSLFSSLFANPLNFLLSLPSLVVSFLDSLFGSTTANLTPPTNSTNNAFVGNSSTPSAGAATSSLPTWLTTSPTAALPSLPGLMDNPNILDNFPGSSPADASSANTSDFSVLNPLIPNG